MPPRFTYWTIIAGGLPTAFRATEREELLPTFNRIHEKHPDAAMKWFARGKLWASPEEAQRDRPKPGERREGRPQRDRTWRPGGQHRDPRQPFKDAKKARNSDRRQARWEHKHRDTPAGAEGDAPKPRREFRPSRPPTPHGRKPQERSHGPARPRRDSKFRPPKKGRPR